jgi:hypothetical protein
MGIASLIKKMSENSTSIISGHVTMSKVQFFRSVSDVQCPFHYSRVVRLHSSSAASDTHAHPSSTSQTYIRADAVAAVTFTQVQDFIKGVHFVTYKPHRKEFQIK